MLSFFRPKAKTVLNACWISLLLGLGILQQPVWADELPCAELVGTRGGGSDDVEYFEFVKERLPTQAKAVAVGTEVAAILTCNNEVVTWDNLYLKIWKTPGMLTKDPEKPNGFVTAIAVGGDHVAALTDLGKVIIWNPRSGKVYKNPIKENETVKKIAAFGDSTLVLISAGTEKFGNERPQQSVNVSKLVIINHVYQETDKNKDGNYKTYSDHLVGDVRQIALGKGGAAVLMDKLPNETEGKNLLFGAVDVDKDHLNDLGTLDAISMGFGIDYIGLKGNQVAISAKESFMLKVFPQLEPCQGGKTCKDIFGKGSKASCQDKRCYVFFMGAFKSIALDNEKLRDDLIDDDYFEFFTGLLAVKTDGSVVPLMRVANGIGLHFSYRMFENLYANDPKARVIAVAIGGGGGGNVMALVQKAQAKAD